MKVRGATRRGGLLGVCLCLVLVALAGCEESTMYNVKRDLAQKRLYGRKALEYLDPRHSGAIKDNYDMPRFEYLRLEGLGVVVGLPGTGDMSSLERVQREEALKKLVRVRDPQFHGEGRTFLDNIEATKWMTSGYVSLVEVWTFMSIGQRVGDRTDVVLRARDGTTSLEGGYLFPTELRPFTFLNGQKKRGRPFVQAAGPVVVRPRHERGAGANLREGLVEAGGKVIVKGGYDAFSIVLRKPDARDAEFLMRLLNERFRGPSGTLRASAPVAQAAQSSQIRVRIPDYYAADSRRFVEVVRNLPARVVSNREAQSIAKKATKKLLDIDPQQRMYGALVLEGLGSPYGTEALKAVLEGGPALSRIEAGRALYFLGFDDALTVADDLLLGGTREEKMDALALYTLFRDRAPVAALQALLAGDDPEIAAAAALALAMTGHISARKVSGKAPVLDLRVRDLPHGGGATRPVDRTYEILRVPGAAGDAIVAVKMDEKRAIVFLGDPKIEGTFLVEFQRFALKSAKSGLIQISFDHEGRQERLNWPAYAAVVGARLEFLGLSWSDNLSVLAEIHLQGALTTPIDTIILLGNGVYERLMAAIASGR